MNLQIDALDALRLAALWVVIGSAPMAAASVWPDADWPEKTPSEVGLDGSKLEAARDVASAGGGSGCIVRHGFRVFCWGDQHRLYDLKSTTKSIGSLALGLALGDGKVSLDDKLVLRHPELRGPIAGDAQRAWYGKITLRHLAAQTSGFEKPGGYGTLLFEPGTRWSYSDGGANWLADCLTLAYTEDLDAVLFRRVFGKIGISREDLVWRDNGYRPDVLEGIKRREFGSGVSASVDALARIGYLMLHHGRWQDAQLLPADFVAQVSRPPSCLEGLSVENPGRYGNASDHYGLLWWNNADGALEGVPVDAFWGWGLYDSLLAVVPSLDMVVVRAGGPLQEAWSARYRVLEPFLGPIAASVRGSSSDLPPAIPVVSGVEWAPRSTVLRAAEGSDNWPMTWADDDALYAAYGDGWGFEPRVPEKLSLGLARIAGPPDAFVGENIRAPSVERKGDGKRGPKASGILMVDGVLYLWARNTGNATLAWSNDHGQRWVWADWRFKYRFGCPSFLNYGRNYDGARDNYVYVYSPDSDNAYDVVDAVLLARVSKNAVRERHAYTFYAGTDEAGRPNNAFDRRLPITLGSSITLCVRSRWASRAVGRGSASTTRPSHGDPGQGLTTRGSGTWTLASRRDSPPSG